jgi:hypothetical protein
LSCFIRWWSRMAEILIGVIAVGRKYGAVTFYRKMLLPRDNLDVRWAGVFGSFAEGTQNDYSRVDVVVIKIPHSEKISLESGG